MNTEPIRVLIVDDHAPFRAGLRALLTSVPDMEVAGEAENGEDAIREADKLQPDVILMDIQMPGMNGIEATRLIYQSGPHIGVIVLTMFEDDDSVFAAMRAGTCSKGPTKPKSCAPSTRSGAARRCSVPASRGG